MDVSLRSLLTKTVELNASDLHICSGELPSMRIQGQIQRLNHDQLSAAQVFRFADELMTETQRAELSERLSVDFSFELQGRARFRANIYRQANGLSLALRRIPAKVMTLREIKAPPILTKIANYRRGLVLVTGPTGSGKSTTLAAIIDHINRNRSEHILTIEDPIEYIHEPKQSIINQREIGGHARSFSEALRAALREDPDVILVGEMRDLETISLAITAAETGHLVLGTLHTNSCPESIDRIVDAYPSEEQKQIRVMLSSSLKAVISQTLAGTVSGGRIALQEIMLVNQAIKNHIREGKTHQIYSAMDTARGLGMQRMDAAIQLAMNRRDISQMEAEEVRARVGIESPSRLNRGR